MLLRRHITKHRRAEPADHRRADSARDVVVAGRDVGGERAERIERRLAALLELFRHVDADLVHRDVARPLDHHLTAMRPGDFRQFTEGFQLRKLRAVIGVGDGTGAQPVAQREGDVIAAHDLADFREVRIEEALAVMGEAPFRHDRAAARDDPRHAVGGEVNIGQAHAGVDGEIVDALFGLFDQRVAIDLPG